MSKLVITGNVRLVTENIVICGENFMLRDTIPRKRSHDDESDDDESDDNKSGDKQSDDEEVLSIGEIHRVIFKLRLLNN